MQLCTTSCENIYIYLPDKLTVCEFKATCWRENSVCLNDWVNCAFKEGYVFDYNGSPTFSNAELQKSRASEYQMM